MYQKPLENYVQYVKFMERCAVSIPAQKKGYGGMYRKYVFLQMCIALATKITLIWIGMQINVVHV